MKAVASKSRLGSRGRPEESRAAILQAAVREFAREGVAGARTDAIARAAGVNKALLYYYFKDKETLYEAVIDQVFGGLTQISRSALPSDLPPREKLLAYVGAHFDYVASHPLYPPIVQGEMMRAGRGSTPQFERIAKQYFRPLFTKIAAVLSDGQATGDFRPVDPMHFVPSMIAIIVFYFTMSPGAAIMTGIDPMAPELMAQRRASVLDFISAALFTHPNSRRKTKVNARNKFLILPRVVLPFDCLLPDFDAALQRSGADRHRGFQSGDRQSADAGPYCEAAGRRRDASKTGRLDRSDRSVRTGSGSPSRGRHDRQPALPGLRHPGHQSRRPRVRRRATW